MRDLSGKSKYEHFHCFVGEFVEILTFGFSRHGQFVLVWFHIYLFFFSFFKFWQQSATTASIGGERLLRGGASELSGAPGATHFVNLSPVQTLRRRRNDQLGGEEGQSTSSDSQRNCATPTSTGVRLAHDSVGSCRWPQDKPSYSPDAHHPDSFASSLPLFAKKKKKKN